ncbi:F-box protein At3g07870 [Linum perenne]
MTEADYLPQEILLDIFHRLPLKSIGSCICTSRYWLSIIKTPDFVSDHFNHQQQYSSSDNPHPLFLLRLCSGPALNIHYTLHYDDYYLTHHSKVKPPFRFNNHSFSLVGSSRGLVCLMHNLYTYNYTITLWNPSIGKTFDLPLPSLTFDTHGAFEALLGFGFDSSTHDYKVVRVLRLLERDDIEIEVEVFSLKARSWKRITPKAPQYNIVERGSQAFVNGSVHWVATTRREGSCRDKNLIVGFQLGDERFRELQLPESLELESPIFLTVSPYKDSTIAVFKRNYLTRSDNEIWVMEEYGSVDTWVRLLTVGMYENGVPRALGFRGNGEVLFELSGGEIVSGDPESFEVREMELEGEVGYSVVSSFQETLVLLDISSACCDYT